MLGSGVQFPRLPRRSELAHIQQSIGYDVGRDGNGDADADGEECEAGLGDAEVVHATEDERESGEESVEKCK